MQLKGHLSPDRSETAGLLWTLAKGHVRVTVSKSEKTKMRRKK